MKLLNTLKFNLNKKLSLFKSTLNSSINSKHFCHKKLSINLPMKDKTLKEHDPELWEFIELEKRKQWAGLEMIASENYANKSILECLGSILTNKYSEGYPGSRYYGGNQYIDQIENLAISRALIAFSLNKEDWGANVQPYSGSPANFAVFTGMIKPGDKIMGLDVHSGGHYSHGYQTETKKLSATSLFFETKSYKTDEKDGLINMIELKKNVLEFKPNIIIVGASAYPRDFDYKQFREAADSVGAYLMADISHISGLIATGELNSPFAYCDVVTTTTHKSLRGPKAGMIFFNKKRDPSLEEKINFAVFPMIQGGPHNHQIAAIATQLKEVATPQFKNYIQQVKKNAKALASFLMDKNYKLITDGTDNHCILWDVRPFKLNGKEIETVCELAHISLTENFIIGDNSSIPGGVRIGTLALTTRGLLEKDMVVVGEFLERVVKISVDAKNKSGTNSKQFITEVENDDNLKKLLKDVEEFSMQFYIPGVDFEKMKYLN